MANAANEVLAMDNDGSRVAGLALIDEVEGDQR
jgi:hypothetical protein